MKKQALAERIARAEGRIAELEAEVARFRPAPWRYWSGPYWQSSSATVTITTNGSTTIANPAPNSNTVLASDREYTDASIDGLLARIADYTALHTVGCGY